MLAMLALGLIAAGSYAVHRWIENRAGTPILGMKPRAVVGGIGLAAMCLLPPPFSFLGLAIAAGAIVPAVATAIKADEAAQPSFLDTVRGWAAGFLTSTSTNAEAGDGA